MTRHYSAFNRRSDCLHACPKLIAPAAQLLAPLLIRRAGWVTLSDDDENDPTCHVLLMMWPHSRGIAAKALHWERAHVDVHSAPLQALYLIRSVGVHVPLQVPAVTFRARSNVEPTPDLQQPEVTNWSARRALPLVGQVCAAV